MEHQFIHITPSQHNAPIEEPAQGLPTDEHREAFNTQAPTPAHGQSNTSNPSDQPTLQYQRVPPFVHPASTISQRPDFQPVSVPPPYVPAPSQQFPQQVPTHNTFNTRPTTPPLNSPWMAIPPNQVRPAQPTWNPAWQGAPMAYQKQNVPVQPLPPTNNKPPHKYRKKRRFPLWTRVAVTVLVVFLILIGSGVGYYYATFDTTLKNTIGQTVTRSSGDNAPSGATGNGDILSGKRINILLLGSDTDVKFRDASGKSTYLAQTDIVVTIDPKTQKVGMLSIPRDTWLNVPGYGMMKLDEAYARGGVALSRYTIHQDFGIYIDYYAWVGLDGFIKVIDTAGGIDVDVTHPIIDDTYPDDIGDHGNDIYAMKRLSLAPGPQHLSGPEALEYVRSRHADLVGDFGRSVRQQQVLTQLKTKLNNPNIISKLPELANDLNGYVKTDMQLSDVLCLMDFARSLDQGKINRVTLGPPYSSSAHVNGQDVVLLDCGQVQPVIATMFDLGDNAKCDLQAGNTQTSTLHPTQQHSLPQASVLASPSVQTTSQIAHKSTINLGNNGTDLSSMHGLLDLMFFVVFESPEATKV